IPELLDYTIGFLEACTSALLQCALVARSWVNPAQNVALPRSTSHKRKNFEQQIHTTELSQHLSLLSPPSRSCGRTRYHPRRTIPSQYRRNQSRLRSRLQVHTNLRTVKLDLQCPIKIRRQLRLAPLVSHQMLRRLDLIMLSDWTIRHIELSFCMLDAELRGLQLENRRIPACGAITSLQLSPWRNGPFTTLSKVDLPSLVYPFEISQLKALSIRPGYGMTVGWDSSVSIDSIKILDIELLMAIGPSSLELSIFRNLQILRIHVGSFSPAVVSTLQTVSQSQPPIHTIVISTGQDLATITSSLLEELDSVLASLPVASLELEQTN
ncbi:hypothetical protein R3P38DRAFT_2561107, partial [Favolaschia claudopus]